MKKIEQPCKRCGRVYNSRVFAETCETAHRPECHPAIIEMAEEIRQYAIRREHADR